jgi:hypothetical protein
MDSKIVFPLNAKKCKLNLQVVGSPDGRVLECQAKSSALNRRIDKNNDD